MTPARTRQDRILAGALFAGALSLYLATSSQYLVGGDNAEMVTLFARGGVPHPSGYPLYCILLRLFAWVPGGPVAGSSRVTAIVGALSVAGLYRACRAWGASPSASLLATAAYALSPIAWRLATSAEVFALHALLASLLLLAAAPGVVTAPARRLALLGFLAGLGLSNHLTVVLLAPAGLVAAVDALRMSTSRVRDAVLAVAAFVAGLSPYLYLYEVGRAPGDRYVWGDPGTWTGLLRHITRADFQTVRWSGGEATLEPPARVALFFTRTAIETLAVPLVIGLFGFAWAYTRGHRRDALALCASWVLAGPVLAALFALPPDGAALFDRFLLLPGVLLTIAVAWGLDAWRPLREGATVPTALAVAAIVAGGALHAWPEVRAEHTDALERYTENSERAAPPGAVLLGTGDYRLFSFLYEDSVHLRPDVTYIDPHLLGYEWYRARASRQLGAPISWSSRPVDLNSLVSLAQSLERPVLLTDVFDPQLVKAFPSYPLGTLIRLLPPATPTPGPDQVERENLDVFARFTHGSPIARDDIWARAVLPTYERPWVALARMFERRGDVRQAQRDRDRAREWGAGNSNAP